MPRLKHKTSTMIVPVRIEIETLIALDKIVARELRLTKEKSIYPFTRNDAILKALRAWIKRNE